MNRQEILDVLKKAANFTPNFKDGHMYGIGAINMCPECQYMNSLQYNLHYTKMKNALENLPWDMVVANPRMPKPEEYPQEDGDYITMCDCNEHEVNGNPFHGGRWTIYDGTHVKWWMKLPES